MCMVAAAGDRARREFARAVLCSGRWSETDLLENKKKFFFFNQLIDYIHTPTREYTSAHAIQ